MNSSKKPTAFLAFVPEKAAMFGLMKKVMAVLEWIVMILVFAVAIVPGIVFFIGLAVLLNRYTPFAFEAVLVISLLMLILLAKFLERYFRLFDRYVFSTVVVPAGQFALGKMKEVSFRLDQPGLYMLKPRAWIFFMGTEEDYAHFDPMSL